MHASGQFEASFVPSIPGEQELSITVSRRVDPDEGQPESDTHTQTVYVEPGAVAKCILVGLPDTIAACKSAYFEVDAQDR